MNDKTPKVFISYSWSSEEYKQEIKGIAERLMHNGVLVELDLWDLKEGQDKYVYMEQCVSDEDIDKVLIFSDKAYAEKADNRQGGVGNETTIISPQIYNDAKQEKFIPIVMAKNEAGEPYLPQYLASRKYIDFTGENYEGEYETLLRAIYEKPAYRKPVLGERPKWLDEDEPSSVNKIKRAARLSGKITNAAPNGTSLEDFIELYIEEIKHFYKGSYSTPEEFLDDFRDTREYRNAFLDFIKNVYKGENFGSKLAAAFEKLYNSLYNIKAFKEDGNHCGYDEFEIFRLHIWELFICVTAYMLEKGLHGDIHELLVHTYFLRVAPLGEREKPSSYTQFRVNPRFMEEQVKPRLEGDLNRMYTLVGHNIISEGEYKPIYTKENIVKADLFLYQVYNGLKLDEFEEWGLWFPICYVYANPEVNMWGRLKSRAYCRQIEKIFGVNDIQQLKECIRKCTHDDRIRYSGDFFNSAPAILDCIKLDEIGILP